ncbi:uncharacterized protein PRCAT00006334001 [Priceomyces carsonii]|uniref:uncharacterized protein n=1 Tax=Priceomyces carsonii TaxID=28549 RepID=UPI002EDB60D8|nr:unnamed protein product [Priceomyces carsonii]
MEDQGAPEKKDSEQSMQGIDGDNEGNGHENHEQEKQEENKQVPKSELKPDHQDESKSLYDQKVHIQVDLPAEEVHDSQKEQVPSATDSGDADASDLALFVGSGPTAFATPSKQLPPLNEIEHISTPKLFSVARDPNSSPVDDNIVKSFLGLETFKDDRDLSEALQRKAIEFEELKSDISLLKFNQEQSIQIHQKKLASLLEKLNKAEQLNSQLEESHDNLKRENSSQRNVVNDLKIENSNLKSQVDKYSEKERFFDNDMNNLLGNKDQEILSLNDSVNKLTSDNIEQSQKVNELTKEINNLRNEKFALKLTVTKNTNELAYIKDQKDWYESELRSVQAKFTDLIKKHETEYLISSNKITSLTNQNSMLESKLKNNSVLVNDLKSSLENEISKYSSLDSKFEIDKMRLSKELESKDELLELTKVQSDQRLERISQLEVYVDELKSNLGDSINKLENELAQKTESELELNERLKRTEAALDAELHKETDLPKLSATSELIASQGISLSSVYAEFNHLKKQLVLERSQKEQLASQLESFVNELESKKPAIASYRDQVKFYENSLKDMIGKIETIRIEKIDLERGSNKLKTKISDLENELVSMKKLCKDLGKQLCYYLIHSKIRDNSEDPLTASERKAIDNILERSGNNENLKESDTDQLISQRLVGFTSIAELQQKNQDLLTVVRQLGKKLESKEEEDNKLESIAIDEAKDAILTLQGELESLQIKLQAVQKENELLKSLSDEDKASGSTKSELKFLRNVNEDLKSKLSDTELILKDLQLQYDDKIKDLNAKLRESMNDRNELSLKVSSMKHNVDLAETRFVNAQKTLENSRLDIERSRSDIDFWKEQASKQEELLVTKSRELRDMESKLTNTSLTVKNLESEIEIKNLALQSSKEELQQLRADKSNLNQFVVSLQNLLKEREESSKDLSNRLNKSIENYQSLQERLNDKEERIMILSNQSELALKAQNTKLEQVNEISRHLLDVRNKVIEKDSVIVSLNKKIRELSSSLSNPRNNSVQIDTSSTGNEEHAKLLIELEQLKEDLHIAESQVNEFSKLAQAAEEALMNATNSFDDYKTQSDKNYNALLKEKLEFENEINTLKQDLKVSDSKLVSMNEQNTIRIDTLKSQLDEFSQKASSYDSLQKDYENKLELLTSDLNNQVQVVTDTQAKYIAELKKNEELSRNISSVKEEADSLKENLQSLNNEIKNLKHELDSKDVKLSEEKQNLEEQLESSKTKIKDLQEQNSIILNQFELTKSSNNPESENDSDLKEVVTYLRREKENAEARATNFSEEHQRLQQRLEQALTELEITKSELVKAALTQVDVEQTSDDHRRLLEQLEQLNILRESNVTLRNENNSKSKAISNLELELQSLSSQFEPLQSKVDSLTTEFEVKDQKIKLLEEENGNLKSRSSVMSDPDSEKEYDALKQKYNSIREKANSRIQSQNERIKELQNTIATMKDELTAANETKQTDSTVSDEVVKSNEKLEKLKSDSEKSIKQLNEQKSALEQEIITLKDRLNSQKDEKPNKEIEKLKEELEQAKDSFNKKMKSELESKLNDELKKNREAENEKIRSEIEGEFRVKINDLQESMVKERAKIEKDTKEKFESQLKQKVNEEIVKNGSSAEVDKLREKLMKEHEDKLKTLQSEFEDRLAKEKEETEKQTVKKYDLKMKLLNKKLDKLENKTNVAPAPVPASHSNTQGASEPNFESQVSKPLSLPGIPNSGDAASKQKLGHQFTESTLTVHRPTVDRTDSNEKKRQHPENQEQSINKKPKE